MANTRTTARERNNMASGGLLVILGIALAVLIGFVAISQGWIAGSELSSDQNRFEAVEPAANTPLTEPVLADEEGSAARSEKPPNDAE